MSEQNQHQSSSIDSPVTLPAGSSGRLCDLHDVALLDLDGVVYVGPDAVPGVPTALERARSAGMQLAFVTNNAARPPDTVAQHLTKLGIAAQAQEVITSAQAAARHLQEHLPPGASVLCLGTTGLEVALRERGLVPVAVDSDDVSAVVQGYSPDMNWGLLAEGCVAVRRGIPWVATNVDPTVPSPRGPLPGNGSLVAALRVATGSEPVVTGKPNPTMHRETLIRTGAQRPIVVGDRLDTDIEGANAVGCPSLLVFSGVSTVPELLAAPARLRPTYLGADAGALLVAHPAPQVSGDVVTCGRWRATLEAGVVELARAGDGESPDGTGGSVTRAGAGEKNDDESHRVFDDDALDAARALCAAAWAAPEQAGSTSLGSCRAADEAASRVLELLGVEPVGGQDAR